MTAVSATSPAVDNAARRRSIRFLNWAHFLDHFVILIFPTVVIGLEAVYGRSYGDLLMLSTAAFTAFGLFALPSGWLADHWSRRNMMAIFFIGTGASCIAVGLSTSFTMLAIALFGVGIFAAIYHPVGLPMIVEQAINRGHTMSVNGVCGNVGVSVAAGITAALTAWIGWRWAFFVPGAIFILTGIVYVMLTPDNRSRHVPQPHAQDVTLDRRLVYAVIGLFLTLSVSSGLVFNCITVIIPKVIDARVADGIPLTLVGFLATAVFLCGALAQLSIGRLVDRFRPHYLLAGVAIAQFIGVVLLNYAVGWPILLALALVVAAIYAQVTLNDIVLARYTPPAWRGRVYAMRFFLNFTSAGPTVWGIGKLYDHGGFDLVLWITAIVATVFVINTLMISGLVSGVEGGLRRRQQPAE
ncbi:MAG: major facilitator superfamily protein [Hyphomicrobiales bacterium]|nr:major facilitator superfamily protein [Hyphomicrobiales bacterium]